MNTHTELWNKHTPDAFKNLPDVDTIIRDQAKALTFQSHLKNPIKVTIGKDAGTTIKVEHALLLSDRYIIDERHYYVTSYTSLTNSIFLDIKSKGVEFVRLRNNLRHISELALCSRSGLWATSEYLVELDEKFYPEQPRVHSQQTCADVLGRIILIDDAVTPVYSNLYYHINDVDDLCWSDIYDRYVHIDDVCHPVDDRDEVLHVDDCYFSSIDDEYYRYSSNAPESQPRRNILNDYHQTPKPELYLVLDGSALSSYTIGFEVEKNTIDGESEVDVGECIPEEPIFAGWETDSSCGYEGITNVYSLNNEEQFIKHASSSYLLDDACDSSCGGHINIADINKTLRYWHLKPWLGLFWSMWRKRLNNNYSSANKKACPYKRSTNRYAALNEKTTNDNQTLFELRLPNRVTSRGVLIRRFKLMQNFMRCVDMFKKEDFSYTQAKYDDNTFGIPNVLEEHLELYWLNSGKNKDLIKQLNQQTYQRTRFHIESQLSLLQEMYPDPNKLIDIIIYAYLFQGYIDEEFGKADAKNWIIAEISAYL